MSHIVRLELQHEVIIMSLFDFESEATGNVPLDTQEGIHCKLVSHYLVQEVSEFEHLLMLYGHLLILIGEFELSLLYCYHSL